MFVYVEPALTFVMLLSVSVTLSSGFRNIGSLLMCTYAFAETDEADDQWFAHDATLSTLRAPVVQQIFAGFASPGRFRFGFPSP